MYRVCNILPEGAAKQTIRETYLQLARFPVYFVEKELHHVCMRADLAFTFGGYILFERSYNYSIVQNSKFFIPVR